MSEQTKYLDEVIDGDRLDVWRRVRGTGYEYRCGEFGHEVRTGTKSNFLAKLAVSWELPWEHASSITAKLIDAILYKHWIETKAKP